VIYLASHWREVDPKTLEHWDEVAREVLKTG
jgi:predicted SnoaL-like aldol condensation-catalyzing enzyme